MRWAAQGAPHGCLRQPGSSARARFVNDGNTHFRYVTLPRPRGRRAPAPRRRRGGAPPSSFAETYAKARSAFVASPFLYPLCFSGGFGRRFSQKSGPPNVPPSSSSSRPSPAKKQGQLSPAPHPLLLCPLCFSGGFGRRFSQKSGLPTSSPRRPLVSSSPAPSWRRQP